MTAKEYINLVADVDTLLEIEGVRRAADADSTLTRQDKQAVLAALRARERQLRGADTSAP